MRWLAGIGVLVVVMLAIICFTASRSLFEPSYKDRSLSQWIIEFDNPRVDQRAEAAEAMRQMGTRAVPFLVERLRQQTPLWKLKLTQLLSRQSIIRFRLALPNESNIDAARRRAQVFAACDALGPAASSALPALEEALYKYRDFDAVYAMSRVGQKAAPFLMRASTSKDYFVRISSLYFLESLRDSSERLSVSPPNSDFFRRSSVQERRMLANWLPTAVPFVRSSDPNADPVHPITNRDHTELPLDRSTTNK